MQTFHRQKNDKTTIRDLSRVWTLVTDGGEHPKWQDGRKHSSDGLSGILADARFHCLSDEMKLIHGASIRLLAMQGAIRSFVRPYVHLSVYPYVLLSVCPYVLLSVCHMSVCLVHMSVHLSMSAGKVSTRSYHCHASAIHFGTNHMETQKTYIRQRCTLLKKIVCVCVCVWVGGCGNRAIPCFWGRKVF